MGLAKVLKAGLTATAYGLKGAAEVAVAQDEKENEWAKTSIASSIKQIEEIKKTAQANAAEERKKNNEINSLHGTVFGKDKTTGEKRALSREEIGQLIGSIGKDKLIEFAMEDSRLEILGGKAQAIRTEVDTGADDLLKATTQAIPTAEKGIAKGQAGRVSKKLESRLAQLGYDMSTVPTKTGTTSYEGGQFAITPETTDLDTKQDTSYVINKDGKFSGQVVYTVTQTDKKTGKPKIRHYDHLGAEVQIPEGSRLVDSTAAVKLFDGDENFPKKSGILYTFDENGDSIAIKGQDGKPLFGYQMKDGTIRLQIGGKVSEDVYTGENALIGTAEDLGAAQLDMLKQGKTIENLPSWKNWTTTRDDVEKLSGPVENERNIILQRVSLLQEYGNEMYGPQAAFATFVVTAKKTITGVAGIVEQLAGMDADEANILISQNEQTLVDAINDRDSILSRIVDDNERIATARVLDSAAASMQAYAKGKANEEGRMTDNDFKIFKSTIAGNTAQQTLALLEQSFQTNLTLYETRYRSAGYRLEDLESLSDERMPQDYKKLARKGFGRLILPSSYAAEVNGAIENAENKLSGKTQERTSSSTQEATTDVVFIAPDDTEITLQYDPSSKTYSHPNFAGKTLTLERLASKGFLAK